VRFQPRTNERDYVEFIADERLSGGSSPVGRQGKRQYIRLGQSVTTPTVVASPGVVMHEIGHAIGLWHEHARMDRDRHVKILWDNIDKDHRHNFERHVTDGIDFGPYDPNSIMHYGHTTFGKDDGNGNPLPTIESLDPKIQVGRGSTLSRLDIEGINKLYPKVSESVVADNGVPFLYHHPKFKEAVALTRDACNLGEVSINDRTTGVRVPDGWTLTLYRHPDFKGESIEFRGPAEIPDLTKVPVTDARGKPVFGIGPGAQRLNWNDQASSARLTGPGANIPPDCNAPTFFEHSYWRGRQLRLEETDVLELKDGTYKFNDIISSLCVPEGWKVVLFEHQKGTGKRVEIVGPVTLGNLHQAPDERDWGDRFSSVRVSKHPAVAVNPGPGKVVVPSVQEMTPGAAATYLAAAKLKVKFVYAKRPQGDTSEGWVAGQTPFAGEVVDEGTTVTLQIRYGPPAVSWRDRQETGHTPGQGRAPLRSR
jgi:hypothetical protein